MSSESVTDATIHRAIAIAHIEATKRGVLNIWTVYDHPLDFPDSYVTRRFEVGKGHGAPKISSDVVKGELETIREGLRRCGLTCLKRASEDEPHILESWL